MSRPSPGKARARRRAYLASIDAYVPLAERFVDKDPRRNARVYTVEVQRKGRWVPVAEFGDGGTAGNCAINLRHNRDHATNAPAERTAGVRVFTHRELTVDADQLGQEIERLDSVEQTVCHVRWTVKPDGSLRAAHMDGPPDTRVRPIARLQSSESDGLPSSVSDDPGDVAAAVAEALRLHSTERTTGRPFLMP